MPPPGDKTRVVHANPSASLTHYGPSVGSVTPARARAITKRVRPRPVPPPLARAPPHRRVDWLRRRPALRSRALRELPTPRAGADPANRTRGPASGEDPVRSDGGAAVPIRRPQGPRSLARLGYAPVATAGANARVAPPEPEPTRALLRRRRSGARAAALRPGSDRLAAGRRLRSRATPDAGRRRPDVGHRLRRARRPDRGSVHQGSRAPDSYARLHRNAPGPRPALGDALRGHRPEGSLRARRLADPAPRHPAGPRPRPARAHHRHQPRAALQNKPAPSGLPERRERHREPLRQHRRARHLDRTVHARGTTHADRRKRPR